jgi:histidyl-tRNA synthetase
MEIVKGFRDFSGEEALKREKIRQVIIKKFKDYGFMPCESPVIEYEKFVKTSESDETISDIFKLKDKGKRSLALRYELTFQLKRLAKNKKLPFRRYQIGQVFRDEPTSSNRFREFTQCDIDVVGSTTRDEAEILKLVSEILKELKIEATIYINNRKLINEILEQERIKNKKQVILELDKLDKLPEKQVKANLKKYKAEKIVALFKKSENFFSKFKAYEEIKKLKEYCALFGIQAKFLPSLARGLAYYNGSIFEIKAKNMRETLIAGGSYLVNNIQSTGISFGLERISAIAKVNLENQRIKCLIISIAQEKEAISLAEKLRKQNISCFVTEKLTKGLEYASSTKISYVVLVGKKEIEKRKFKLRNMDSGKEEMLKTEEIIRILSK